MMSGAALCPWAVFTSNKTLSIPADLALELGRRLNCSLPQTGNGTNASTDLLNCLRSMSVQTLIQESVIMQAETYQGGQIFSPVSGDSFGVLPKTPKEMLAETADLVGIPTIVGYTTDDGSWLVPDPENEGFSNALFLYFLSIYVVRNYPSNEHVDIFKRALETYVTNETTSLNPIQLRTLLVRIVTESFMVAPSITQARLFSKAAAAGDPVTNGTNPAATFVYQFNHRPSYSSAPLWHGVGHADEKGFVLGLPRGPDPFRYPNTTLEDEEVADLVTTMWTNFAKFGHPTPEPFHLSSGKRLHWPRFGSSTGDLEQLLLIDVDPKIVRFDRNQSVAVWMG